MISRVHRLTMLLAVLAASTCGGGDGLDCSMANMSTLDPGQTIVSLSQDQRREFCDDSACMFGGYGARVSCAGGAPITIARSQAMCLASTPTDPLCLATVQDYLDCTQTLRANPCASTLFSDPACAAVTAPNCLTFTSNAPSAAVLTL